MSHTLLPAALSFMYFNSTRHTPLRLIVSCFGGLAGIFIVGILPAACQSGGVGDPCIPEDEYSAEFSGYDMAEDYIESRSFQCQSRICLVNHFQGRVSCPLGQPPPRGCASLDDTSCGEGQKCVESASLSPDCNPGDDASQCKRYVCHSPGSCQHPLADEADNRGKSCCVPGTDTPVAVPACGQCSATSSRDADAAVYCSCRCGPPDGAAPDGDVDYCECPTGFECKEIRKDYGLGGDKQLAGKYCIKPGSAFESTSTCGKVKGYFDPQQCKGISAGGL